MRILVDGDQCSRRDLIISIAKKQNIPVIIYCDINHEIHSKYATIKQNKGGFNMTDMQLFNDCQKGDIVITNDINLAGLALLKCNYVINNSGRIFDNTNIDFEMIRRGNLKNSMRKSKSPRKGTKRDFVVDRKHYSFGVSLKETIEKVKNDDV